MPDLNCRRCAVVTNIASIIAINYSASPLYHKVGGQVLLVLLVVLSRVGGLIVCMSESRCVRL